MELNTALENYQKLQAKISAYGHAMALIYYDGTTTAPSDTASNRARTLSVLSEESYILATGKETLELLEFLDEHKNELDSIQARSVFLSLKDIREMQKIPIDEYVAYQELLVEADDVWHKAKETDDFALFLPCLEKIFEYEKRFALYCAPDMHPYNYCLNKYEDGLNMKKCDEFFAALKSRLVPLIKKIGAMPQIDDSCLYGDFPTPEQERFALKLMDMIGIDKGHCGLSTTEHPFTTSLGSHHDVRITTNYKRNNFASSMFSVIHEGGHALYDMGSDDSLAYTNLDGGVSMGIHESQSRFYENLLGRSRAFSEYVFPIVCECFPSLNSYTSDDFYRAINKVEPSLIRVEADEVTYALHVMVRYELEKRVMSNELDVKDLPAEWNRLYKEYLGVDVPSDREGVLQDSHWSGGAIGYFPSYALGSAYGAHFLKKMKEKVDVDTCIKSGNFTPINAWNKENIWKHGQIFTPGELLERVLGEKFDPFVFTDYLEKKYSDIYGLK